MRTLVWKFWVTTWFLLLAMFLLIGVAVSQWWSFNDFQAVQLRPDRVVMSLADELERRLLAGEDVSSFLEHNESSEYGTAYLIDMDGEDVLGRALPEAIAFAEVTEPVERSSNKPSPQTPPILARAIYVDEQRRYYLIFAFSSAQNPIWTLFREVGLQTLLAFSAALSAVVAWGLVRMVAAPIDRLSDLTTRMLDDDFDIDFNERLFTRKDEVGSLARRFGERSMEVRRLIQHQRELVRDLSHEIRSPLARMHVAAEILEVEPENRSAVARIVSEISVIDRLVEGLVKLSKLETVHREAFREEIDLRTLLDSCARNAEYEVADKRLGVRLTTPSKPCPFAGDPALLMSLFDNLVRNAVHHSPPGEEVFLNLREVATNYEVAVEDRGPGVPEAKLRQIFEPFARVDDSRTRATGGYGLGLTIAERIVRVYGGDICAHNLPGRGFAILVNLPIAPE